MNDTKAIHIFEDILDNRYAICMLEMDMAITEMTKNAIEIYSEAYSSIVKETFKYVLLESDEVAAPAADNGNNPADNADDKTTTNNIKSSAEKVANKVQNFGAKIKEFFRKLMASIQTFFQKAGLKAHVAVLNQKLNKLGAAANNITITMLPIIDSAKAVKALTQINLDNGENKDEGVDNSAKPVPAKQALNLINQAIGTIPSTARATETMITGALGANKENVNVSALLQKAGEISKKNIKILKANLKAISTMISDNKSNKDTSIQGFHTDFSDKAKQQSKGPTQASVHDDYGLKALAFLE